MFLIVIIMNHYCFSAGFFSIPITIIVVVAATLIIIVGIVSVVIDCRNKRASHSTTLRHSLRVRDPSSTAGTPKPTLKDVMAQLQPFHLKQISS